LVSPVVPASPDELTNVGFDGSTVELPPEPPQLTRQAQHISVGISGAFPSRVAICRAALRILSGKVTHEPMYNQPYKIQTGTWLCAISQKDTA
jgi:hypothetical protein